jgi:hypothetical protein
MRTTILAYVIAFAGLVTLGLGIGSLAVLVSERAVPMRHYAAAIGMISGGLGLGGLAQALRLLAEILTRGAWFI